MNIKYAERQAIYEGNAVMKFTFRMYPKYYQNLPASEREHVLQFFDEAIARLQTLRAEAYHDLSPANPTNP